MLLTLVVLFSPRTPGAGGIVGIDKVVHAALFGALAASTRWRFGRGLSLVLGYAVLSEVLQAVLPVDRDGDLFDVLADSSGAALCWLVLPGQRRASRWSPDRVKGTTPRGDVAAQDDPPVPLRRAEH